MSANRNKFENSINKVVISETINVDGTYSFSMKKNKDISHSSDETGINVTGNADGTYRFKNIKQSTH